MVADLKNLINEKNPYYFIMWNGTWFNAIDTQF
jgi:hypothetical protein